MQYVIGFVLIIVGGVSTALTGFAPLALIMLLGVVMFASVFTNASFVDYIIAGSREALVRKRYYIVFFPFVIISKFVTLGKGTLIIPWKQEYFRASRQNENGEMTYTPLTRKEYLALRDEQRKIYSTQTLSREFMQTSYSPEGIGLAQKKKRLVLASVFAGLMLTTVTVPGGFAIALIYEAIFVPMILLWLPAYKDAKILQQAYDRAMGSGSKK